MHYKDKYNKTLEDLYFATRSLSKAEREEEINITILSQLQAIINDFIPQVDKMTGERKTEWEMRVKTLITVFNHIGGVYYSELMWRKKCFKLEKEILDMSKKISELEYQNEKLMQIDSM